MVRTARGARVLIIDDEPFFAFALRRLLAPDHDALVAIGGAAGLGMLRADPLFEVVLCDVMMPGMGGPELYEATRAFAPALLDRFVFMTGGVFSEPARAFLGAVPNTVLEKPFSPDEVRRLLARFAAARAT